MLVNRFHHGAMSEPSAVVTEVTEGADGPAIDIPLTPPAEATPVTPDGNVLKLVLQPGSGPLPALHARCLGARACRPAPAAQIDRRSTP